ncbi:MAG: pilus assembly protein TadG-related protein [Actinomycetota bacterium]|nr:pilus assembly protein TadG-related protein [Actinomycetota bacterium]
MIGHGHGYGHGQQRDRGSISVVMLLLLVIALGGAGLVVDGGRAMVARRHAANTAEAAARAAVSTATPLSGFDRSKARAAALDYAARAGVPARDVTVEVGADFVSVTVVERRSTVFLILGGQETMTVRATGTARVIYSD